MIAALTGHLGAGKTFGVTYFAWLLSYKAGGLPVLSNYTLREEYFARHAQRSAAFKLYLLRDEKDWLQFTAGGGGVVALDELHRLVDARMAMGSQNVVLTHFFMFLRKIGATTLVTDQHMGFMDARIRAVVDVWIRCSKLLDARGELVGFRYDTFDQGGRPRRTLYLPAARARALLGAYNTREIVRGFQFPRTMPAFDKFLEQLDLSIRSAQERAGVVAPPAPSLDELDGLLGMGA